MPHSRPRVRDRVNVGSLRKPRVEAERGEELHQERRSRAARARDDQMVLRRTPDAKAYAALLPYSSISA